MLPLDDCKRVTGNRIGCEYRNSEKLGSGICKGLVTAVISVSFFCLKASFQQQDFHISRRKFLILEF